MSERVRSGDATPESADDDALLQVEDLKKHYAGGTFQPSVRAVDGVSLDVDRGETLGLVGESGCGKTTFGRTVIQLESATEGEVLFDGTDVTSLSGERRRRWERDAQMVFQDPESSLNDRMTVGQIVREPLDVHDWPTLAVDVRGDVDEAAVEERGPVRPATGTERDAPDVTVTVDGDAATADLADDVPLRGEELRATVDRSGDRPTVRVEVGPSRKTLRKRRVQLLLDRVGLREEHYYRYPHQFSGGQRQRVAIARAIALEPEFVVLDEPVSALDVSVQARIINLLEDLQAEYGLTYLFIAHDLAVVRHIADRVAVMYLGNVVEVGDAETVFSDPAHPYTASLLSAIPGSSGPDRERITLRGTPPNPRHPPAGCPFSTRCPAKIRPEEFAGLSEAAWEAIDTFREVLRQRAQASPGLRERAKQLAGVRTGTTAVVEVIEDQFGVAPPDDAGPDPSSVLGPVDPEAVLSGDRDVPDRLFDEVELSPDAERHVYAAALLAARGDDAAAEQRLVDAFGSVCDEEHPDLTAVGGDRTSRCLRHGPEHEDVVDVLARRHDR